MHRVGVKTSQIMDYMVQQSSGHENVGFTLKDLYNHVDALHTFEVKDVMQKGYWLICVERQKHTLAFIIDSMLMKKVD